MKKLMGFVVVLGLAATPAFAQKVIIDYAHDFDSVLLPCTLLVGSDLKRLAQEILPGQPA